MNSVYFIAVSPAALARHLHSIREHHYADLAGGAVVVVAEPRHRGLRPALALDPAITPLPAPTRPGALTAAEVAAYPAKWGVTTADSAWSALKKCCAQHGAIFDPEV